MPAKRSEGWRLAHGRRDAARFRRQKRARLSPGPSRRSCPSPNEADPRGLGPRAIREHACAVLSPRVYSSGSHVTGRPRVGGAPGHSGCTPLNLPGFALFPCLSGQQQDRDTGDIFRCITPSKLPSHVITRCGSRAHSERSLKGDLACLGRWGPGLSAWLGSVPIGSAGGTDGGRLVLAPEGGGAAVQLNELQTSARRTRGPLRTRRASWGRASRGRAEPRQPPLSDKPIFQGRQRFGGRAVSESLGGCLFPTPVRRVREQRQGSGLV